MDNVGIFFILILLNIIVIFRLMFMSFSRVSKKQIVPVMIVFNVAAILYVFKVDFGRYLIPTVLLVIVLLFVYIYLSKKGKY